MQRIGVKELRQNASHYLKMVKNGQKIEVSERGELVALLIPPNPASIYRDKLISDNKLLPATSSLLLPQPRILPCDQASASQTLTDIRQERLL